MEGTETDKEQLLRLQLEMKTARQVEEILTSFKKDIDDRLDRFEVHLQNRPTNDQMVQSLQKYLDDKELVYKAAFYDEWVKAHDKHSEQTQKKTNDWTATLKNIGFLVLIAFGLFTMFGNVIKDIVQLFK